MFLTLLTAIQKCRPGSRIRKIAGYLCPPHPRPPRSEISYADFLSACEKGDTDTVKAVSHLYSVEKNNAGLIIASRNSHTDIIGILVANGATNLDEALREACITNRYASAEILVQKGANVVEGLKVAKSANIIRMLYRYEQNSENIN